MRVRIHTCLTLVVLVLALVARHSFAQNDGKCNSNSDCSNGGVCDLDVNDTSDLNHINKVCQCINDYTGPKCEDRCLITCQNGGICVRRTEDEHGGAEVDSSEYICQCPTTYDGPLCATKRNNDDTDEENDITTSSPVAAPSPNEPHGSDGMSSTSASVGKIFGIVFGVGSIAVLILLFVIYSRRRTIHIENNSGGKNVVEGTTVSNDLTITHDMAETIATDDVSVGDRNNFVTTTTSTNNATVAMTEDGPRFVPDTTYSHTVKLHDVA